MKYLMDILFGFLGFFVGALVWELVKGWCKREWATLTTRKSFAEVQREMLKDFKRPRPLDLPGLEARVAEITEKVEQVAPKRKRKQPPLNPGRRYSVAEILAAARKEVDNRQR